MTTPGHQFASDNCAGICPEAWQALEAANSKTCGSYGTDSYSERATALLQDFFETSCQVFFVYNGTAANGLALSGICRGHHAIFCHPLSHIVVDECGIVELFTGGARLVEVGGKDCRIQPDSLRAAIGRRNDVHFHKPGAISLTQATEAGTVYTPGQVEELAGIARSRGLKVHMDGARFANAVAALGCTPKAISWQAGVQVLSLGGTKDGLPMGEAVVFFDDTLAAEFSYLRKRVGQLASKMRFLAAPWIGILEHGALLTHAAHANQMARRLADGLQAAGFTLAHPVEANGVFVLLPKVVEKGLKARGWNFHSFFDGGVSRLMCGWATTEADVDMVVADATSLAGEER